MLTRRTFYRLLIPTTTLAAWQLSAALGYADPLFFPAPTEIAAEIGRLTTTGELPTEIGRTVARLGAGFAWGAVGGLLLGCLMVVYGPVRDAFEPLVAAGYTTPKLSLLPLLMLLLGLGEMPRLVLIGAGAFIVMTLQTVDAGVGIDPRYADLARNYGAGRWALVRWVYLPATLPQLFTGLRLAAGRSLTITIAVELVNCPDGIGHMIWIAWQTFATERIYIGILAAGGLGMALHAGFRWIETRMISWRQGEG